MLKMLTIGSTALVLAASPLAGWQAPSAQAAESVSAADFSAMTDARVNIVKAALQLTPEQEKLWPPVEEAIRARAKNRQARLAAMATRVAEIQEKGVLDALRNRDPIAFMERRADALAQRSADFKKLAEAWKPLYQSLSADQKKRMAFLTILVLREMRDGADEHHLQIEDSEEGED
jgi:hypothetical protein